eukprot:3967818-Pyramimonas_sp.AAC.1
MKQNTLAGVAQLAGVVIGQPVVHKASLSPGTQSEHILHTRLVELPPDLLTPNLQEVPGPFPQNRPAPDSVELRPEKEESTFVRP